VKPNPLTPFPSREGGNLKASLLIGERFGEGFSISGEKSESDPRFLQKVEDLSYALFIQDFNSDESV